jgi:hypothetical protein
MRKALLSLLITATATALIAGDHGSHRSYRNLSISTDDYDEITSCDQIGIRFDGERGLRAEEDLPVSSLRSLKVRAAHSGGIQVTGWNSHTYAVKVCKAAPLGADLSAVRGALNGNEVSAIGPDDRDWVVYFLVRAPRNATLDLSSDNGGVDVKNVNGNITASVHNGPLALKDSSGTIEATSHNGPVSFAGGSGSVTLRAHNGPLAVKLDGGAWDGTLDASTENGPLTLRLPRDFRSGVVVEANGHGPVSCHAEQCRGAKRAWSRDDDDDDAMGARRLELGSGPQNVHLSTVNGPVSVRERD